MIRVEAKRFIQSAFFCSVPRPSSLTCEESSAKNVSASTPSLLRSSIDLRAKISSSLIARGSSRGAGAGGGGGGAVGVVLGVSAGGGGGGWRGGGLFFSA